MNGNDLNLRDFFASQAMKYWMEHTNARDAVAAGMEVEELVAVQAYMMADAMIAVRNEK